MKKLYQILIFSFCAITCFGQIGIINDPDGFTNVRQENNSNSEILFQIKKNEAFFFDIESKDLDSSWIKVWFPQNKYSKYDQFYTNTDLTGYIHKSRIKPIDSLRICNKSCPELTFNIQKADSTKTIEQGVFGLELPLSLSYEVSDLNINWNNQTFKQDPVLFNDLYNMTFDEGVYSSTNTRFKTFELNGTYFIKQQCADGAGYYEIVWVIKNGITLQRLVGWVT